MKITIKFRDTILRRISILTILFIFCIIFCIALSDAANISVTSSETLDTVSPQILISVFPKEPVAGEELEVVGQILPDIRMDTEYEVFVYGKKPGSSGFMHCFDAFPDEKGYFSATCIPDISGEWKFRALYCGVSSPTITIVVSLEPYPKESYLTLSAWPRDPMIGETVSFTGHLVDQNDVGLVGKPVSYYVAYAPVCGGLFGGCGSCDYALSWQRFGTVKTGSDGSYSFRLPVVEEGNVVVRTSFDGDDTTYSTRSKALYFSVRT